MIRIPSAVPHISFEGACHDVSSAIDSGLSSPGSPFHLYSALTFSRCTAGRPAPPSTSAALLPPPLGPPPGVLPPPAGAPPGMLPPPAGPPPGMAYGESLFAHRYHLAPCAGRVLDLAVRWAGQMPIKQSTA